MLEEQERRKERAQLAREREMRLRMERDEVEADRRKHRAAHSDAVAAFQTLLGEVVKDPDVMWRDWKGKLERDPQVGSSWFKLCWVSSNAIKKRICLVFS